MTSQLQTIAKPQSMPRRRPQREKFWSRGEPMVWVAGGTLAAILLGALVLLLVVLVNGLSYFWPAPLEELQLTDGTRLLGRRTANIGAKSQSDTFPFRTANKGFDKDTQAIRRVKRDEVVSSTFPLDAVAVERVENSDFYGTLVGFQLPELGNPAVTDPFARLQSAIRAVARQRTDELDPLLAEISAVSARRENLRDAQLKLEFAKQSTPDLAPDRTAALQGQINQLQGQLAELDADSKQLVAERLKVEARLRANVALMHDSQNNVRQIALVDIIRVYQPNSMGLFARLGHYFAKVWELLSTPPRESKTEGGVLPALFGTVALIFLMAICSFPLGVLAGVYLGEYAQDGALVRLVRIGVNNLAGIPSIVYGIFGVGFFIDFLGAKIDENFYAYHLAGQQGPVFGTGGVLWAALTLGLLTVPVVIVATEEAIRVIPRGVRESSYALGATKFQTLVRVLVPLASPGILTGFILAMARAAGEVAPLMLTGVVNEAATLPLDGKFPYFHLERQFMHLGYQLYSVAFQSPDAEAARPLVYVIALLLVLIVLVLSGLAIFLRNRMRKTLHMRTI
jgi:phosphate transport system permease protein